MPAHQDLTIFSTTDDEVPLAGYGTVDVNGDITEATFSTDPTHPRPYLKRVLDFGESAVDFLAGGSLIGQLTLEVVDAPRDEEDQDSGIMTYLAAAATGDTALLGVRMVFREAGEVIFDGVCGPVAMSKLSTFRLQLRDMRERERDLKLFNVASETCIFPRVGAKEGWGRNTEYNEYDGIAYVGEPVFPRIKGVFAQYRDLIATPGPGIGIVGGFAMAHNLGDDQQYRELLLKYGSGVVAYYQDNLAGAAAYRFDDVLVEWSLTGDEGTYVQVGPMTIGGVFTTQNVFDIRNERVNGVDGWYVRRVLLQLTADEIYAGQKPDDGQFCWVRVVSNREPNKEVPLFIEERFGELLQRCYDGDYTRPGTMVPVRYDVARMDEMIANTPMAYARIEEPAKDGRQWLQENVYRPSSHAPSIRNGVVYPLKYELPDEDEPLTQLDDSNTVSAEWAHGPENIVNQVIVHFEREIVPTNLPQFAEPRIQKAIIDRSTMIDSTQRRHGSKPQELKPVTLRSIVSEAYTFERGPMLEVGAQVSTRIASELLRRYANGAQVVNAVCHRTAEVDALNEGDWVIGAWSWLPNYQTRTRGMNRLMQVMKVRRALPHQRAFLLVDAGPHDQPIDQPTVGALVENSDGSVTIPITDVAADGRAHVEYALGPTEPDVNSGEWRLAGYLDEDGDVRTPPNLWPGRTLWARARGTANGRRASAWTNPVSINLSDVALLRDYTLDFVRDSDSADYGKPLVQWDMIAGTGGVKVRYLVHAPHSAQPALDELVDEEDFDANDGEAVLDVVLRAFEQVTVQIVAYPGFAAGAVTGDAGAFSTPRTVARVESHFVKASIGEIVSRDGFMGLLELEIIDQQLTITSVWFRTREGSDAADWTAFAEDGAAPFETDVQIIPGASSAIGYEVYAYDHVGIERLFKSGTVEYPYEGSPSLRLQITEIAADDPANEKKYEVRAIDPVPQGDDSITLFAEEDGATILDPTDLTSVGVPTGVVTDDFATTGVVEVVVERPQYVGGSAAPDGAVHFRAEASGRGDAIATQVIPAEEAPEETVFFDILDLTNTSSSIIEGDYTLVGGSAVPDHVHMLVRNAAGGVAIGDYTDAGPTLIFDTVAFGWNLNPAGAQVRTPYVRFVAYDADDNVIGLSDEYGEAFNADADS